MSKHQDNPQPSGSEFTLYAGIRIVIGIAIACVVLYGVIAAWQHFKPAAGSDHSPAPLEDHLSEQAKEAEQAHENMSDTTTHNRDSEHGDTQSEPAHTQTKHEEEDRSTEAPLAHKDADQEEEALEHASAPKPTGVLLVEACIKPLENELNRFYGWRPNDIIQITDNVNNFQLGVLEVTRRTAMVLAERISRTGSNIAFDPHLQNAMNLLMISADQFWLPQAEDAYQDALDEWRAFKVKLETKTNKMVIHNRADNLIPLLAAYEDLLGSSDDNLVKSTEDDGEPVSFFMADDYFFYAKGVASAMGPILEAIHVDFHDALKTKNALDVLHHAIESCHQAAAIDPWLITDNDLDSIIANHRANMAAPISHARFYLGVLIKSLST